MMKNLYLTIKKVIIYEKKKYICERIILKKIQKKSNQT